MRFLNSIDISASGLTAQRLWMDTIANNMANAETTRVEGGDGPYKRQVVVFEARKNADHKNFKDVLKDKTASLGQGVRVKEIRSLEDTDAPFRKVYDPSHPDADQEGYLNYPNVNIVEEMMNMIAVTRSYEANAKVIEATKGMAIRALDIGR
ncbi:MAG TPA: flagellar basal body rod protein FlgC [Syntrophomonadaceae bacterium]|nr:flagellar basal body rod protein FlgC [Syntrophomonadaceae bacterium]